MSLKIDYREVMSRVKDDVDYVAEEAYNKGYEQAKLIWSSKTNEESYQRGLSEGNDIGYKDGVKDGWNEAWEAARKIVLSPDEGGTSLPDLFAMFGNGSMQRVFRNYSASEAIEKLKAHEEKQESKDSYERGCEGCQWEANVSDTYYPCSKCCNSYKNRYERKEKCGNE